jgi:hypothetical protein
MESTDPSFTTSTSPAFTSGVTPSQESSHLSTGAIAGIGTGIGVILLAVLCNLIGACYLRHRRERALRIAVEEVERGVRLKRALEGESEEQVALDDSKDVVFSRSAQETDRGDAGTWGGGRKGMSLPRIAY